MRRRNVQLAAGICTEYQGRGRGEGSREEEVQEENRCLTTLLMTRNAKSGVASTDNG